MAYSKEYRAYVEELLQPVGKVTTRGMFGGVGIFYRGLMFALISDDELYFKVDDRNRGDYEAMAAGPFTYEAKGGKRAVMSYYRVPDEIADNEDDVLDWARRSVDAALRAESAKAPKKKRKKT